jgi:hypothetical protein
MEFSITVSDSEDGKYILLRGKGDIKHGNPQELIRPILEVYELAERLKIYRLLADVTQVRNLHSPVDDYEFVNTSIANEERINRFMRIALLVAPEDHSHDFMETVARNAKFMFTIFRDRETALAFLLK